MHKIKSRMMCRWIPIKSEHIHISLAALRRLQTVTVPKQKQRLSVETIKYLIGRICSYSNSLDILYLVIFVCRVCFLLYFT